MTASYFFKKTAMADTYKVKSSFRKINNSNISKVCKHNLIFNFEFTLHTISFTTNIYQIPTYNFALQNIIWTDVVTEDDHKVN